MAEPSDEQRPVLVTLPLGMRARLGPYLPQHDCLMELTAHDLVNQVQTMIGTRFYPSWGPVADFVEIIPSHAPQEAVAVYFVIGTVADLRSHLRLHLGSRFVGKLTIRIPDGYEQRTCIFVVGACWV